MLDPQHHLRGSGHTRQQADTLFLRGFQQRQADAGTDAKVRAGVNGPLNVSRGFHRTRSEYQLRIFLLHRA